MKIPQVKRFAVARVAVSTKRTSKQIIRKINNFALCHDLNPDKVLSTFMMVSTFIPKIEDRIAPAIISQETPIVRTVSRKASSKILPKIAPKTADQVKLIAKGGIQNTQRLNILFNSMLLNNEKMKNPLNNKAPIFVKCAKKHGVDPTLLMAIAMHESARGTSNAVKTKRNIGGIMTSKQKLKIFSNIDLCIDQMAETLAYHHREDKINTVKELAYAGKYCAKNEASEWIKGVMYYINELQG